ncbi:large ribosomal subunit protein mL37 [Hyperolius riggenbachi]|uniref:large ribosomal subunit protein mL37 n=1 Tax=Hyperolius riggenbachi TaxID=752182 RepID=UPI0035A35B39
MAASMLGRGVCGVRSFSVSVRCCWKRPDPPRVKRDPPQDIPGLERVTFADLGYYTPYLSKPVFPRWQPEHQDPQHYRSPPAQEMALYREEPAYIFNPKCRLLGGVKQALWLTKSSLIEGLPESIASICDDSAHTFPDPQKLLLNTVSNACLWSTIDKDEARSREEYCPLLLRGLLHLCRVHGFKYPQLTQRSFIDNYRMGTSWRRESILYMVRGMEGIVMSAKSPLEPLASPSDIQLTEQQGLSSLHPLHPAIDLQEANVYEERSYLGFRDGFPFSHPHTLYLLDPCSTKARFQPDQLRAKMIITAFGSAAAKAKMLFGEDVKALEKPVVVQSVGTDGQLFHFMVLQLNTLDLESSDGIKNIVWMDGDQALYDTARAKSKMIKNKTIPHGVRGLNPATFLKFWAMYLNGAI